MVQSSPKSHRSYWQNMQNISIAAARTGFAQSDGFNPWNVPESFTVYAFAPDYVKPLLHPHWQTQKAVHPLMSYFVGFYFLIMGIVSATGNTIVLKIFSKCKSLRTPANMLIMNLAVSDLCLMIALVPESIINFFCGGPWQFGNIGCQLHAFCGALFGYSQITTLTFISYDRYNVIVNGLKSPPLTYARVSAWITFNWIWALLWAVTPVLPEGYHWGIYTVDGMLGTCAFDSYTQTWNNKTYMVAACFFQYGINIIIIYGSYIWIVKAIFKHEEELRDQAKRMNVSSLRSNPEARQMSAEIKAAKVAIIAVTLWTFSWTPFVILCITGTWGGPAFITPLISEIPIIMAKTSTMFNPIIYALSHPKYRVAMKELFPWLCIVPSDKDKQEDFKSINTVSSNH